MTANLIYDLPAVLAALVDGAECRAYTGIVDGTHSGKCTGEAATVTVACEHEHVFDVRLCDAHRAAISAIPRPCPLCNAALREDHCCRMAEVGVPR